MQFIDLHSHILPGVDDGSSSVRETVAMLRLAHAGGTRALVATPHFFLEPWNNTDPVLLTCLFERLTDELRQLGDDENGENGFLNEMTLYLGAENYISTEFFEALDRAEVVTMNTSRYVLIEFPPFLPFTAAAAAVERILRAGKFPVLAHIERYPFLLRGTKRLAKFVEMGCVAQVNASTFTGAAGRALARRASKLLDAGLVHLIASDGHGANERRPDLSRAAEALGNRYPPERVSLWMWENAARILDDKAPAR